MEVFVFALIFSVLIGFFASSRGRSGIGWFFLSCIISPLISLLILLFLKNLKAPAPTVANGAAAPTPESHVKCPECRELVFKDASKCRFCGCKLVPQ